MKRWLIWLPLAGFALLFGFVAYELVNPADRTIRSKLVGKPLPQFSLPPAYAGRPPLGSADFTQGQPRLLNVFASWCAPCKVEAPILADMARRGVPIDAIAVRDTPQDVEGFLRAFGNPYQRIGSDVNSSVQLALGSSGVPETFVIDGQGVIRHQHIGDIKADDVPVILDALGKAR